ncbi:MAG TPA: hydroxymethylbilane synthase, partial [Flavobacteriales bacterium]
MSKTIIIGTRGSDLALWQANHVKSLLEAAGHACELHIIKTKGDNIQHLSFDKIEGKGFFTKEIEEALLNKEVDIAVHSHKDLETNQPDGLCIAAVSPRADERELLLILPHAVDESEPFGLKKNAIVGTSSARRKAQMLHHKPDIELKDIRGNVPTRIQKLRDGQFDAILLAKAGVDRLGLNLDGLHAVALNLETFVPAPAQGALALQCRSNDEEIIRILSEINDAPTQELLKVERTVLNRLNGGCQLPL